MTSISGSVRCLSYAAVDSCDSRDDDSIRSLFKEGFTLRGAARATYNTFSRKKPISPTILTDSRLARCLTTLDLTALGIGSTLGVGVYVLAGNVSKYHAGPAVIISFLIAAIASIFAGLCYAEFGARVPKAGSAYIYSYVCVGEFIAFIIGWNLILEYVIGSASVVRGLSQYLDSLLNNTMSTHMQATMPIELAYLSPYPDFFAFTITMVFSVALAFGAKESSNFNNAFTVVNLCVVVFVIISGSIKANTHNWQLRVDEIPKDFGNGGFAPYGVAGIIRGAAACFYGFIGFDCVATAGEEAKNPQKSIPIAVVASLLIIFLAYFGVSSVLTLMLPYYLQDGNAPLPHVYNILGWNVAKYIVSVGAMCGLCSSLLGAMFPLPRIIYAMASDGLMFQFMGNINGRFQTPLVGTLVAGLFTGTMAAIFQLDQLINMMSIGTLLAYSMVASCVLILRYNMTSTNKKDDDNVSITSKIFARQLVNCDGHQYPTKISSSLVTWMVTLYSLLCFALAGCIKVYAEELLELKIVPVLLTSMSGILVFATLFVISRQPVSEKKLSFAVPFVPWLPGLSILINVYLMLSLDVMTWVRFTIWIAVGLLIYFSYGIWHSVERHRNNAENKEAVKMLDLSDKGSLSNGYH
ncbi:cationic amino acid transporter 2 [Arctopsyche grandis]|uniref:cationic amino acid transporter 2 n=1 Tax=Arctopsyche grandis TaxID=121162 RepID=UPI00406D6B3A